MNTKPKMFPIQDKYHLFRGWWIEERRLGATYCGRIAQIFGVLQTCHTYKNPDLCQRCLQLRPKAQRGLAKSKRRKT